MGTHVPHLPRVEQPILAFDAQQRPFKARCLVEFGAFHLVRVLADREVKLVPHVLEVEVVLVIGGQVLKASLAHLFQGGLVSSQVRSAKLRREQARLQVQAAERDLRANLAAAWYGFEAAKRAIEASERQVEAAEIAFNGAQQELSVGTRTTLDVLDSEQDLLNARLALVNAERDANLAAYRILTLTGQLTRDRILPGAVMP